jgi:hypothetical protein
MSWHLLEDEEELRRNSEGKTGDFSTMIPHKIAQC